MADQKSIQRSLKGKNKQQYALVAPEANRLKLETYQHPHKIGRRRYEAAWTLPNVPEHDPEQRLPSALLTDRENNPLIVDNHQYCKIPRPYVKLVQLAKSVTLREFVIMIDPFEDISVTIVGPGEILGPIIGYNKRNFFETYFEVTSHYNGQDHGHPLRNSVDFELILDVASGSSRCFRCHRNI